MTVLYFADTRFPIERANGAQTMATCHALARQGHDVTLVVRPDSATPPRDPFAFYGWPPEPRLTITTIAPARGVTARRLQYLLSAVRLAAGTRGVVFTRDLGLASFLLQLPAIRRPRVVYESHGLADVVSAETPTLLGRPDLAPSAAKLARLAARERRVWRRAAEYVAITHLLADELGRRFGPRARVSVVPDGVADALVDGEAPGLPDGPPTVGYAGHLYPWKGVDVMVRAIAQVAGLQGVIVGGHPGEADLGRVQALARELGVFDRIRFVGLVPPSDVARHLAGTTMLVLPNVASAISERYTSPLKLFEYLALGRPIVASDLPALREILSTDDAELVAPGDATSMAQAFARLIADPARAGALAARGRTRAAGFTWSARAARLSAVLAEACA